MDEPDRAAGGGSTETATQPVAPGSGKRRSALTAMAIVSALLIGVARPWDLAVPATAQPTGAPDRVPAATRAAERPGAGTPAPSGGTAPVGDPYAALWITCGSPSGWRAATIQRWTGRPAPIRSWIAIDPGEATGPLDPRIPFAPVATDLVTAIGYCAPLSESLRPPASTRATLWAIVGEQARPLAALPLEPAEPDALGGLWRPAPEIVAQVDGTEVWPPGRYVVRLRSPSDSFDRWLGIEIDDLDPRGTATAAPGSATASPRSGTVP